MPHVSHTPLKTKVARTISDQFIQNVASLDQASAKKFFSEFFTKTERVMFAKRLAIMLLLEEGFSSYRIARVLNVSTSTVIRMDSRATGTRKSMYAQNSFFEEFRNFLFEGLSMSPKRRVRWLNDFEKKYATH